MAKFLITGITGFAGAHLANLLHKNGHEVYGLIRRTNGMESDIRDVVSDDAYEAITFVYADLTNYRSLRSIFEKTQFDGVFHLAAQSHPPTSFIDPIGTMQTNVMGSANLIQVIQDHQEDCKLMFCSTSEVYGNVGQDGRKIHWEDSIVPSNPYDCKGLLKSAIRDNDPVIFMESEQMYGDKGEVPEGEYLLPIGVADIKRKGTDVTIVSFGKIIKVAYEAADLLAAEGISCEIIDLRTVRPIDYATVIESVKKTNRLLGTQVQSREIANLLESIEFTVEKKDSKKDEDILTVTPPSFRVDISRPEDLMEEVARLSGYNNIPTTFPVMPSTGRSYHKEISVRGRLRRLMTGFGFRETTNYSFMHQQSPDRLRLKASDPRRQLVDILNPLTEDQAVMRTSLVPGLLGTVHYNFSQQIRNLKIFEIGKIFINENPQHLPKETEILAGLWTGSRYDASWHDQEEDCDFFDIKGVVEALLIALRLEGVQFSRLPENQCTYTRPGYTAQILHNDTLLGLVGEAHPQVLANYDLKQVSFLFELYFDQLVPLIKDITHSKPIPKFPAVVRDITIIVDNDLETQKIINAAQHQTEALVESFSLLDVFEGQPIAPGKKSVSLRVTYRSSEKTLEDEDVTPIHQSIAARLVKQFKADLPA